MKRPIAYSFILILSSILCGCLYLSAMQINRVNQKDKDFPEQIKEKVQKMKNRLEKNEDEFPTLIKEMEDFTTKCPDSASVAVLHSMIAEMYNHYYYANRWKINERTSLSDFVPDDIREWSQNLFKNKIKEELEASLRNAQLLQQTPADKFSAIMTKGKDSPTLRPTLFDFLSYRAIEIQPQESYYLNLLAFRNTKPGEKATMMSNLDYLQYKNEDNLDEANTQYRASLDSLLELYKDKDFCIEIIADIVDNLEYKNDSIAEQYNLCKEWIARYPNYERINLLKNRLADIEKSTISVETNKNVYPGKTLDIQLNYKNTQRITVLIYNSLLKPEDEFDYPRNRNVTYGKLVKKTEFNLIIPNTYTEEDTVLHIAMNNPGLYHCVIKSNKLSVESLFSVSRLAGIFRNVKSGTNEVLVTDFSTGKPIDGAEVNYFGLEKRKFTCLGSVKTDKNGLAQLPMNSSITAFQPIFQDDSCSLLTRVYQSGQGYQSSRDEAETRLVMFTDRKLYRPGQTVFFKAIAYLNDAHNPKVAADRIFSVSFRDANYKEISSKEFKTNAYGSFNGEFVIPKSGLNGTFSLVTSNGSTNIRVEEYKRPTFLTEFEPIKEDVAFGDEVTIKGKAHTYSGVPLTSGNVTWRIVRRPIYWFWHFSTNETQVAEGKTSINGNGEFSFSFYPEKDNNLPYWRNYLSFEASAVVTDSKGESQEANTTFSVGSASIILSSNLKDKVEKSSSEIIVSAKTLNGESISTKGTYTLIRLVDTEKNDEFQEKEVAASGHFTSETAIKNVLKKLESGRYRLRIEANDSKNRPVKTEGDFILYGNDDKQPPTFVHLWTIEKKTICDPGEDAQIVFGTSDKNAYVLYEWFKNSECIKRERIEMSNENRTFRIPFDKSFGDGIVVVFTFVKDGKLYTVQSNVIKKQLDRNLTLKPTVFRDKLLPGSKETWTFNILNPDSSAAVAEVLASMYDASLDQIVPFSWGMMSIRGINVYAPHFSTGKAFETDEEYDGNDGGRGTYREYQYNMLDWQGALDGFGHRKYGRPMFRSKSLGNSDVLYEIAANDMVAEEAVAGTAAPMELAESKAAAPEEPAKQNAKPIRENFNELACFFPTFMTDREGNVKLQLTMPESNTSWKLQVLAHTADMKQGLLTKEVVTSKPLMVIPNLPRFIRHGDRASFSSQVVNHTDKPMNGKVRLELFNPATDKLIEGLTNAEQSFDLQADSIASVNWNFDVPTDYDLIGIRIIADSNEGSDGEQHLLPILSDKVLITESTPFYLLGEGEKKVSFPLTGSTKSSPLRLTLEMTGNPVWYAVQALPTLTEPQSDNIICWTACLYSNTLSSFIAKSNPRIQKIIGMWNAKGGTSETLFSNLQKNTELKNILLEETPWVLEAENETEQKNRLALLFDLNRSSEMRSSALQQLLKQQNDNGSWSWFKGMPGSDGITLFVVETMNQLHQLKALDYTSEEKEMLKKAISFLDSELVEDFNNLKKYNKSWRKIIPGYYEIEYLLCRSAFEEIPLNLQTKVAADFYTKRAVDCWKNFDYEMKGQTAMIASRNGYTKTAMSILSWLRKTATISEEMGMYWANNKREYNFFISPIDVHCILMEAFNEINPVQTENNQMKQWLLTQKRTQNWNSDISSVNAIYALLLTGSDWLSDDNRCTAEWNGTVYDTAKGEIGTGYLKQILSEKQPITNNIITLNKTGKSPAWGAVYHQYLEKIDAVNKQKGVMNVEKKLFLETNSGKERQLTQLHDGQNLKVGDKVIVRLTVRTDREMDYVCLKDLRGGCFEPVDQTSGCTFRDGVWYYESSTDVSQNIFFYTLPVGTFVLEYELYVSHAGSYAGGYSTIQCLYAPEFVSHTEGLLLNVSE